MFLFKSKVESTLKYCMDNKLYKKYRVNILCRTMIESIEKKIKTHKGTVLRTIPSLNIICASLPPSGIERLTELPEVKHITQDGHAFLCGSSVLGANGMAIKGKFPLSGKGIGVAVIDSGVYPHPDLLNPGSRIKKFTDIINGYRYPYDDHGHGTFISGIICGSGYNSKGMYRGVAENATLYMVKAFNSLGRAYISDILYSLELISEEAEEFNIRVICLPFELMEHNPTTVKLFSKAFERLTASGIIPVVPSGSQGCEEGSIRGLAALNSCITVGGLDTTTSNTLPYAYSSSGPVEKIEKPNIAAACVEICSLNTNTRYIPERNGIKLYPMNLDKPYATYTGTSCASAFISGVIALLFENKKDLTFRDVASLLKVSSSMVNASHWVQGAGMVDLQKLMS
ncbi:MAG: S8 family serine peptidase [Bacillota bacterium]|nr:S8 family serine peptidase [Bacillota bacterium]